MNRTVLIGLDGATFTILDPLMNNGVMPFLKKFVEQGVRAGLMSTTNPLTPPAWTTLMTGRSPGNHGVFDFIWAEERETNHYFTLYNFRDIRCETIWSIVSRQNGEVCSLNFPFMAPPPSDAGYIVPGLVSWKHLRLNVSPAELFPKLKEIEGFNAKELAWDFDMEDKAAKGVPKEDFENWVDFHIRREKQWFNIARHIMKNDPRDLMAILFDGPDKLLHMGWRFLDPNLFPENPSAWEQKIRDLCLDYFRELDGFIEEIADIAGPDARIFIASDHGFGPSWHVFRVNTWLQSQGYLTWLDLDAMNEKDRKSAEKVAQKHFVMLDWDKTTAYARTITSNGIYIRVAKGPNQTGVPPEKYEAFRKELMEKLLAVRDPETGKPVVKRILTREEAYPGTNNEQAPDLLLAMDDCSFLSIFNKSPVIYKRPEVEGTHYPEGVFMARGPGISKGASLSRLSIIDVAPALLHSLGLKIPSDFEGGVPTGAFDASFLKSHPPTGGEPTRPVETFTTQGEKSKADKAEEDHIYKQMKALGYME